MGKLGRQNVAVLRKGDIESPSDYDGVVYVPVGDGDAWKDSLEEELKAAGLGVDANGSWTSQG